MLWCLCSTELFLVLRLDFILPSKKNTLHSNHYLNSHNTHTSEAGLKSQTQLLAPCANNMNQLSTMDLPFSPMLQSTIEC